MSAGETGQVTRSAAEVYEDFFVPALFQQWADRMIQAAQVQAGQRVLDVACGTGVFARAASNRVGAAGSVIGVDVNEGMLAVARRVAPEIEWHAVRAEALPFEDATFDVVGCQFGLMFFEDRPAALREMVRVLCPGRHLAVAVWDRLEASPGYAAMVELLRRLFGEQVAAALDAPFVLGDRDLLQSVFEAAGIVDAEIRTEVGTARFPSLASWIYTDIRGWTLAEMLDDDQLARLQHEAETELRPFVTDRGTVEFAMPAHIVTAPAR
ncbi:MAG TPA: class I SAM-dependent methyltransferase [Chloroflexota bacterium]|nr:class I SAM-dependent methyltransferase [Chloroflexota bacterium]